MLDGAIMTEINEAAAQGKDTLAPVTDERLREAVSHIKTWVMCEAWAVDTIEAALEQLTNLKIQARAILNSDMAQMAEDEGRISPELNGLRHLLGLPIKQPEQES